MPALAYPIGTSVKVFRDDDAFNGRRWFEVAAHKLNELHVATYDLATDDDGDYSGDWERDSAFLVASHPGCVFVYSSN